MRTADIGILGGSGLYHMEGMANLSKVPVATPFGKPSDEYVLGEVEGRRVAFLPRHGRGHTIMPSEINHRANIMGFKKLGVRWLLSVSAVGSLKQEYPPRDIVLVDQYFDRRRRDDADTFFGDGVVAHVAFGNPVCGGLLDIVEDAIRKQGKVRHHRGGTYVNMEGPAFSTRAESQTYRKLGFDVIGMTGLPEAKLAREAEICFAPMAMVTDYDCWHESEDHVNVQAIIENLKHNSQNAKEILRLAIQAVPSQQTCGCADALRDAVLTPPEAVPAKTRKKLQLLLAKHR